MEQEKTIHLKKDNILRLYIEKEDGTKTGEYLEFDLDDLEIFERFEEIEKEDKKIRDTLKGKLIVIEKQEDTPKKQKDFIKAEKEFFKAETQLFNKFLGDNGVEKLLYGRKLGWTTLGELNKIVEEQIQPLLKQNARNFKDIMKDLYGSKTQNEGDVME